MTLSTECAAALLSFRYTSNNNNYNNNNNVWFQKISIPPPWRELKIPRGWGSIPEGREVE